MTTQLIRKNKFLYAAIFVFFLLSFNLNIFGVGLSPSWFDGFDPTSEDMTHRTIECAAKGDYKGGLVNINQQAQYCKVYPSQFGLQGYVYGGLGKLFPGNSAKFYIIQSVQLLLTMLLGALLLVFVLFAHQQYGKRVAIIVAAMLTLSVWLVGYANQMYWVTFTFFLPFIISLYFYPRIEGSRKRTGMFLGALFIAFMFKYLDGYEYFVATALSATAPVVYWEFVKKKYEIRRILTNAAIIIAVSVLAFGASISLHAVSLIDDYGSFGSAVNAIKGRGEARSAHSLRESYPLTVYNFIDMQPELYQLIDKYKDMDVLYDDKASPLTYTSLMIFSYLMLPVITIPVQFTGLINVIVESFVFWMALGMVSLYLLRKRGIITLGEYAAFRVLLVMGLAGIVSWHLLFPGHAFVHEHMVGISYYMPTMLWVYLLVAMLLTSMMRGSWYHRVGKRVRRAVTTKI